MYVERTAYPISTLGPGNRFVIWVNGCSKQCHGCANPELWETPGDKRLDLLPSFYIRVLMDCADRFGVHRLTFTGGDPLEQSEDLLEVLLGVRERFDDILVYTGYTLEEARRAVGDNVMDQLEGCIDVLIDGPYVDQLNDNRVPLRGSTNQVVHYFTPELRPQYEEYMARGRAVMNFVFDGRALSIGIHNRERHLTGDEETVHG